MVDLDVVGVGSDGRGGEIADLQALNIGPLHRPGVFDQRLVPGLATQLEVGHGSLHGGVVRIIRGCTQRHKGHEADKTDQRLGGSGGAAVAEKLAGLGGIGNLGNSLRAHLKHTDNLVLSSGLAHGIGDVDHSILVVQRGLQAKGAGPGVGLLPLTIGGRHPAIAVVAQADITLEGLGTLRHHAQGQEAMALHDAVLLHIDADLAQIDSRRGDRIVGGILGLHVVVRSGINLQATLDMVFEGLASSVLVDVAADLCHDIGIRAGSDAVTGAGELTLLVFGRHKNYSFQILYGFWVLPYFLVDVCLLSTLKSPSSAY